MTGEDYQLKFELKAFLHWTIAGRALVFVLAATSIWCLLAEFYGFCSMRTFTIFVSLPAMLALAAVTVWGKARLRRAVLIGAAVGLIAAVAYDVFRLPFVFAREWGIDAVVPAMPLFKVFPRFGAMILGEATEQATYSLAAYWIGWIYHFSNGVTFGVMFIALVGDNLRRRWVWGIAMATGIELAMLATPYTSVFAIRMTATFVVVTLAAHLIFGAVMGLSGRWLYGKQQWQTQTP